MKIEFSTVHRPLPPTVILPFCAYHVEADGNYKCKKGVFPGRRGSVAIRTVGGCGRLTLTGEDVFELTAGSLLFVPAWKLEYYATNGMSWHFWWFEFENGEGFLPAEQLFYLEKTVLEEELFNHVIDAMRSANVEDTEAASTFFSALMYHWREEIRPQFKLIPGDSISRLMKEIREFPEKDYRIPKMAESSFMSDRRFRMNFFERAGMTPKEYIIRCRMERAGAMLLSTTMPVSQIAEACGYSDPLYFSRQFSKYCGINPSGFRQNGRNNVEDN